MKEVNLSRKENKAVIFISKINIKRLCYIILLLYFFKLDANGQSCDGGGCSNFTNQFPSGTFSTTSSTWSTVSTAMNAGNWTLFSVTSGNTYEWTYCNLYGGLQNWDAALTLYNNTGLSLLCYQDNSNVGSCPNAPYLRWTATFTGTVRLLTSVFTTSSCQSNTGTPRSTLVWRQAPSCSLPTAPTGLVATAVSSSQINVSWNSLAGATDYEVDGGLGSCPWGAGGTINLQTHCNTCTSVSVTGLNPNTTYRFIVLAKNACGWGTTFNCISATTQSSGCTNSTAPTGANANPTNIPSGNSSTLTVSGGSLGSCGSWKWYSGSCGGTFIGTGSGSNGSITVSPTTTTTYFVRAEGGNTTACASVTVTVSSSCSNSTAASGAIATPANIPVGNSSVLTVSGGSLGSCASWKWYSGSCGGTFIGTGSGSNGSISVSPTTTTTYFVRAEGGNTTTCVSVTVTVTSSCSNSTAPTGAVASPANIPAGNSSTLTVSGGSLGSCGAWKWYSGSCGGTFVGTGSGSNGSISVSPTTTTTYFVRAEGGNTTACASTIVTVAASPVTYWIGASTQPQNNSNFPTEKPLLSATSVTPANSRVKICADGSKATIIKLNCDNPSLNMQNIRFRLESDPNNQNANLYGEFNASSYYSSSSIAQVRLTHPNYLNNSLTTRDDNILAYDINNPSVVLVRLPIRIYHAPILFVHGLWGGDGSFEEMDNYFKSQLGNSNIITVRADYSANNGAAKSFSYNSFVLPQWLVNTLNKAINNNNFSSGKVDVICHSMGGVLTRLYLQSASYQNDIHTLTTVNTPHSGTQSANLLRSSLGLPALAPLMNVFNRCVTCGAVSDLKFNSTYFQNNLNGNTRKVPSLVYTSDSYLPDNTSDWGSMDIVFACNSLFFISSTGIFFSSQLPYSLYRQEISDVIVPFSSQAAGVIPSKHYNDVTHTNSEKNSLLFSDLKDKLGQNPQSSVFNQNGFQHSNLSMPWWWWNPLIIAYNTQTIDSIKIIKPVDGSVYNVGDTINFHVSRLSHNINFLGCALMNQTKDIFNKDIVDSALQFQYIVPSNVYGKVRALAYGINNTGSFDYDSIFFYVNINANLNSIKIQPDSFLIPQGTFQKIIVNGFYSDSIVRNISTMPGMTYSVLNSNIVTITGSNILHANQIGTTKVIANYQGFTDTIYVTVYSMPNKDYASFSVPNNIVCGSGNIQFTDESGGDPISWNWQFPGGNPSSSTAQNPLISYNTPGRYDVNLITTWSNKMDTLFMPGYIIVDTVPQVSVSGNLYVCQNSSTILTANGAADYHWNNGTNSQSLTISNPGTYTVMGQSMIGCPNVKSVQVIMRTTPTVSSAPVNQTVCSSTAIAQINNSNPNNVAGTIFTWTRDNTTNVTGIPASGTGASINGILNNSTNTPQTTIFTVTATANGCSSTTKINVTVNPIPIVNSIPASQIVCSGTSISPINNSTVNNVSGTTYSWSRDNVTNLSGIPASGSGTTIGGTLVNNTDLQQTTSFTINAIANGCKSITTIVKVIVNPLPKINLVPTIPISQGEKIRIGETPVATGNGPFTYKWSPNYAMDYDTVANPVISPNFNTTYSIKVTDKNGCSNTKSTDVKMIGLFAYPNPTNNIVNIYGMKIANGSYQIYVRNAKGQTVIDKEVQVNTTSMDEKISIGNFPNAIYYITIEGPNAKATFEIVKMQ